MVTDKESTPANGQNLRNAPSTQKMRLIWGAERVFLAWIRTAIALIALGFLIARLSGLLRIVGLQTNQPNMTPVEAVVAGTLLMGLGGLISLIATWRYRQAHHNISAGKAFEHSGQLSVLVGLLTALISVVIIISVCVVAFR